MKPAAFDYVRARDLGEALDALAGSGEAKLIAGGQSLVPLMNLRLARPTLLVDVSRLEELKSFEDTGVAWRIGAAVTHAEIEDMGARLEGAALLAEVAAGIAYRSVRTKGTIGGSLAHADPAGDWPLALIALDAVVHCRGRNGEARRVAAADFMRAAFTTALRNDEIIELVEIAKLSPRARCGYFKFCRKAGDFPETSAAVVIDPDRGRARVLMGALPGAPRDLPGLARALADDGIAAAGEDAVRDAVTAAAPDLDAIAHSMHSASVRNAIRRAMRP